MNSRHSRVDVGIHICWGHPPIRVKKHGTLQVCRKSITRRNNLSGKAEEYKGRIDVEKMKEIMSTSLEDGGPMHTLTRYQIVAVPEDLILHINIPSNGKWVELRMSEYFN